MINFEERQRRFASTSQEARIAFLAAAGERILPIYEKYWTGDYIPEIGKSFELGWRHVLGRPASEPELKSCSSAVGDAVEFYNEESIAILSRCATLALRVLQCIQADSEQGASLAAARGYAVLVEAAQNVDKAIGRDEAAANSATTEELSWLRAALVKAETWTGPVSRNMFSDAGQLPPAWWLAYSAAASPLG